MKKIDILNNGACIEIPINKGEFKKIIIGLIQDKDINFLKLLFLSKDGELRNAIISYPKNTDAILTTGDFIIYDGNTLYNIKGHKIISIENNSIYLLSKETIAEVKKAAYNLYDEINEYKTLRR